MSQLCDVHKVLLTAITDIITILFVLFDLMCNMLI